MVKLTVTLGDDSSGNKRTRSPLSRRYSVIPSMATIFLAAGAWARAATGASEASRATSATIRAARAGVQRAFMVEGSLCLERGRLCRLLRAHSFDLSFRVRRCEAMNQGA